MSQMGSVPFLYISKGERVGSEGRSKGAGFADSYDCHRTESSSHGIHCFLEYSFIPQYKGMDVVRRI